MAIGPQTTRQLRASELDQVSGGFVYGGDGNGFVRLPPPHTSPLPVNPPTNPPVTGGGSGGTSGGGLVGRQPPRFGGHGIYLF